MSIATPIYHFRCCGYTCTIYDTLMFYKYDEQVLIIITLLNLTRFFVLELLIGVIGYCENESTCFYIRFDIIYILFF